MPAAGRRDGKYVKKIHWQRWKATACGKYVPKWAITFDPDAVTCKTCLRAMGWKEGDAEN